MDKTPARTRCLSTWTKDRASGSTLGLKIICNGLKAVIITWNETKIRTIKFDNLKTAIEQNTPFSKEYEYLFTDRDHSAVKSIINTSANTFCLSNEGRIFYFVSFKCIEFIPNLNGVRAIRKSDVGFVSLRNVNELDVLIEFYTDRNSSGVLKKYKKISVSWEGNTEFPRTDEKSTLWLDRIDSEAKKAFYGNISSDHIEELTRVVLFSVNSSLNCIFYDSAKDSPHSEVIPVQSFVSDIVEIFTIFDTIFLLLDSGIIQYLTVPDFAEITPKTICLGLDEISAFKTDIRNNCIYLSDLSRCLRVRFRRIDSGFDWTVDKLDLPGVVAISIFSIMKTVVFVTLNNLFYALNADTDSDINLNPGIDLGKCKTQCDSIADVELKLLSESSKYSIININHNKQIVTDNCQVDIIIKSRDEFLDHSPLVGQNQVYDLLIVFHSTEAVRELLLSLVWSLEITVKCHKTYTESVIVNEEFLKMPRLKVFHGLQKDNGFVGADMSVTLTAFVNTQNSSSFMVRIPLPTSYRLESVFQQIHQEEPKNRGEFGFKLRFSSSEIMNACLECLKLNSHPSGNIVIALGREIILFSIDNTALSCEISSESILAVHLVRKFILLQSYKRGTWKRMDFEPAEALSVS